MRPKRKRKESTEKAASPEIPEDESVTTGSKANLESFQIPVLEKQINCQRHGSQNGIQSLIFTHGAGGTLDAPAMVNFASGFAANKSILSFQGNMNLKSRVKFFQAVIEHENWGENIGGRSMGARAAVITALDDVDTKRLLLVSYPLQDKKGTLRDQILLDLGKGIEVLFISGDRDEMCDLNTLNDVRRNMKAKSWLLVVNGADHGMNMKPKKATDSMGRLTGELAADWLGTRKTTNTERTIHWNDEEEIASRGSWGQRV